MIKTYKTEAGHIITEGTVDLIAPFTDADAIEHAAVAELYEFAHINGYTMMADHLKGIIAVGQVGEGYRYEVDFDTD